MSQTISVAGLTPDAVRAVEAIVDVLRPKPEVRTTETAAEWVARFRAWAASHPTTNTLADDSRESIYAGRGE